LVHLMAPAQLGQVQKVLDAAVVNPVVEKEYQELMRKSIVAQSGRYANRDPDAVRLADKKLQETIPVGNFDMRIKLDFAKLLAPDALLPTTDNPDEAAYLRRVSLTLAQKGIWLLMNFKLVRRADDPSSWTRDPRGLEVWLSVGPYADRTLTIPTETGQVSRESLLRTTVIGAGYYDEVNLGLVETILKKAISRIREQIADGETLHGFWQRLRTQAATGVFAVSDFLGGADFPNLKIWELPHQL